MRDDIRYERLPTLSAQCIMHDVQKNTALTSVVGRGSQLGETPHQEERVLAMLYTIAVILVILWLLGLITSYTMGGFVHVLLVIAIIVVLVNVISGRKRA